MAGLTTVLVVHETQAPAVLTLVALCDEHRAMLRRATWCGVDELVGFSSAMACEACALIDTPGALRLSPPAGTGIRAVWPLADGRTRHSSGPACA